MLLAGVCSRAPVSCKVDRYPYPTRSLSSYSNASCDGFGTMEAHRKLLSSLLSDLESLLDRPSLSHLLGPIIPSSEASY